MRVPACALAYLCAFCLTICLNFFLLNDFSSGRSHIDAEYHSSVIGGAGASCGRAAASVAGAAGKLCSQVLWPPRGAEEALPLSTGIAQGRGSMLPDAGMLALAAATDNGGKSPRTTRAEQAGGAELREHRWGGWEGGGCREGAAEPGV